MLLIRQHLELCDTAGATNMRDEESKPGFPESKPGKEMKKWCQGRSTPWSLGMGVVSHL